MHSSAIPQFLCIRGHELGPLPASPAVTGQPRWLPRWAVSARRVATAAFAALVLMLASGCSFLEAAGEVTLGAKEKIPRVTTDLKWPSANQLLGDALASSLGTAKAPEGLPSSLSQASLAHIQGLMTIDGECRRSVLVPVVESKVQDTQLRNLHFELINCYDPQQRCIERCAGFRGMKMEVRIEFQLLNEKNAKTIKQTLSDQTSPDAIAQVRAQFFKLNYFEAKKGGASGEITSITKLFANSELGLASAGGGDDTSIVSQRYIGKISPTTPQRFEIDPKADFTKKTKQAVLSAQTKWIEIYQRIDIPQQNLYAITLGGGGVELDFQPEFVISALAIAKSAL